MKHKHYSEGNGRVNEPVELQVSEPVELKVSGVMDMLEQEFQVLTAIEQGKIIGGSGGTGSGGGDYGSGGPGCDPLSSTQMTFMETAEGGCYDQPYWDKTAKVWTIGVGHKLTTEEYQEIENGTLSYSHQQLMNMFEHDIDNARKIVDSVITNQNISQNMYGAMVDLVFNSKASDFIHSNMVKDINEGHFIDAGLEFEHWNLQDSRGIDTRRANEENMFFTPANESDSTWTYTPGMHTGTWEDNHPSGN